MCRWRQTICTDLFRLGVLGTVCMCLALVINQLREPPLPMIYVSKQWRLEQAIAQVADPDAKSTETISTVATKAAFRVISLKEFRELVQSKTALVLDARPEIFHQFGHVPGAISLSREDFEQNYAKQRLVLESRRDQSIAVYCSGEGCVDSQMVGEALVKLGYHHVAVFKGGWDEWKQAGLPEER